MAAHTGNSADLFWHLQAVGMHRHTCKQTTHTHILKERWCLKKVRPSQRQESADLSAALTLMAGESRLEKTQAHMATSGEAAGRRGEGMPWSSGARLNKDTLGYHHKEMKHSSVQLTEVPPWGNTGSRLQRTYTSGQASIQSALIFQGQSWLESKSVFILAPGVLMTMFSVKARRQ